MGNPTADNHHAFAMTATRIRFMAEIQLPDIVVRSNATFAGGGTFLVAAREGVTIVIRFNIQGVFRSVALADDNSDFDSDFGLESDEHTEASTDKAPDGNTGMVAGQASSKGNPEKIVVERSLP